MGAYNQSSFIPVTSGLYVGSNKPIDYRIVVADSAQRFSQDWYTAYNGLIVYQQDTQEVYVLINKGSEGAPTIDQPSSWKLVGSGAGSTFSGEWAFTNTGPSQSFAFQGAGLPSPENDPTIYLMRGQSYRFSNNNLEGVLPFQIQSDLSTAVEGGTAYDIGITNNRASGSQQLIFNVPMSAPDNLFYQCPLFPEMSGSLIIVGSGGKGSGFPFSGSAEITGSLGITGSINVSGSVINQLTASQAQFVPFDGNRPISNLDLAVNGQQLDLYGENMNANGLADFVDQVFFRNSPPVITTTRLRIQEFEASSSVVGQIIATDPENLPGMTFATVGSNSNFAISSTGEVTMKVLATSSLNDTQDNGNLDPSGTPRDSAVFKIQATDQGNLTTEKDIFIRITPNIAPIISNNGSGNNPISPNVTKSILESSTLTTPNPNPKFTFYSRDMDSDNLNSLSGDTVLIETGSLTPPFSSYFGLVIQNNNTKNPIIKVNQTVSPLDFETFPSYSFVLTSSDSHYGSGAGQDPNSITYLPVQILTVDNNSPLISDWNAGSINEKSLTGSSAGNITTISDPENDTIQFVKWNIARVYHTDNPSVNLTQSYNGTSLLDPSIDPFIQPNDGKGTFTITRGDSMFLNSDLANRYVYDCGITDYLAPDVSSASIEISIIDHGATTPTVNNAANIIESARVDDAIGGGFSLVNSNGFNTNQGKTKIQTNNVSQDWNILVKSPGSLPTDLFEAFPDTNGSYVEFKLKSNLSGSGITSGQNIILAITASQSDFTTTKQFIDKTIAVKPMVAPAFQFQNQTTFLNTNGARPGTDLVKILITDTQGYPIDHSTFSFSGTGLKAVRDGSTDNYFVQSNGINLSDGTYSFSVSVENDRGFIAGSGNHTFNITDANNGALDVPTANIIESATTGNNVVTAPAGFGLPQQQSKLSFNFNPSNKGKIGGVTTSPSVVSITNTTAGSPIDIVSNGADIGKLSVNSNFPGNFVSGDPISVAISFTDNYGNTETGNFDVSVKANNPPSATFTNQSANFTTTNATSGVDMINITSIQDPQGSSTYTLALSGTDASKFVLSAASVSNNGTSKVQVGSNPLTAGSYDFTVKITNPFGKFTEFARTINIGQSPNFGRVYIYSTNMAGYQNDYKAEMGIASVSGTDPIEIATITGQGTNNTTIAAFDNGNIGTNSVNLASSFTLTKLTDFIGSSSTPSLKTLLENNGTVTVPSSQPPGSLGHRIIILVPYNSSMTDVPIKMTDQPGTNANFGNMYLSAAGAFNLTNSTLNLLTLSSPQQGYNQWLVIGTIAPGSSGDKEIRIQPETVTSTPT